MSDIASYKELILADAPLLYIPLDGVDGVTDATGNGRDGTAVGGPTIGGIAGPGDALTATNFDFVDDRVTTAYSNFANGNVYTWEWWQKRTDQAAEHVPIGSTLNTGPTFRQIGGVDNLDFFPDRTGAGVTVAHVTATVWCYVMAVFDEPGNKMTVLVGDSTTLTTTVTTGVTAVFNAAPGNFEIGGRVGAGQLWKGGLGHVAYYAGDLSSRAVSHWGWGLSTLASRNPNFGYPQATNFPSPANLPRGEALGQP